MKEFKREYATYDYFNSIGLQEHFEKMALQGWLIMEIHTLWYIYKRIEPQKLHFHITYIPYAPSHNGEPTEKELELEEFCLKNGWKLVANHNQMNVFYNESENPIAIETDVVTQVENLRKSVRATILTPCISYLFLGLTHLLFIYTELTENTIDFLSSTDFIFRIFFSFLFLFMAARGIYRYYHWLHKAKSKAENEDEFLPFSTQKNYFAINAIEIITLLLLLFATTSDNYILVMIGLITFIIFLIIAYFLPAITRKHKVLTESNVSLAIYLVFFISFSFLLMYISTDKYGIFRDKEQIIVGTYEQYNRTHNIYDAPLPLTLEDLADTQGTIYSKTIEEKQSSFLLSNTAYLQKPIPTQTITRSELWYRIVDVKQDFLYEYCKESVVNANEKYDELTPPKWHYEKINNEAWEAKEVYQEYEDSKPLNAYFLCYENRFIYIRFPFTPNDEQIKIAGSKLKNIQAN